MQYIYKLGLIFALLLLLPLQVQAWDLTGVWNGNPAGTFYITQDGDNLCWYGEQSLNNPTWTNVAYGRIYGNQIILNWADVPKGISKVHGSLTLNIISNNELSKLTDISIGGPQFGVTAWTR